VISRFTSGQYHLLLLDKSLISQNRLAQIRQQISDLDFLIAATCLEHNLTLSPATSRAFRRCPTSNSTSLSFVPSGFSGYSIRMFGNKQKPKITRNKNITTIETGTGTYTILYGLHVVAQNPDDVPERITGIILETGIHPWLKDPVKTIQKLKNHPQYKRLFDRLEREKTPVLFADVKYKYNDFALILADNVFTAAGWIGGMRLISQLIRNDTKSQRGFVANLAYGLASAWLLLPVVSNMTRLGSSITGEGTEQSAHLKKLSHKLHPEAELLYLSLRRYRGKSILSCANVRQESAYCHCVGRRACGN
jgi:hypothetical protein